MFGLVQVQNLNLNRKVTVTTANTNKKLIWFMTIFDYIIFLACKELLLVCYKDLMNIRLDLKEKRKESLKIAYNSMHQAGNAF